MNIMSNKLIASSLYIFLNFCFINQIYAQETTGISESDITFGEKIKDLLSNLNGNLKLNLFDHFHNGEQEETGDQDKDRYRFEFDLKLDITGDIGDSITYYSVTPRLRFDNVSWATGVIDEPNETDDDRFLLNIDEAYLAHSSDRFDISFGKMKYEWGTADGYNPTDNINPYDFTDIPTAEKIGVPSISLSYSHDLFNLELVFIPLFSTSRLPGTDNRWIGDLSEAKENFGSVNVLRGRKELPVNNIDNFQYAIRLGSSTLVSGWDFFLSYYDGIESVGVLRTDLDTSVVVPGLIPPNLTLFRVFPHYREFGADFSTTFNKLEVHGEAAAHITDGNRKDDDYLEYVVGINYNFDEIPFEFLEEIMVILEYTGEEIFDKKTEGKDNSFTGSGDYFRSFKNSVLTSIDIKFSEDTKFEISGAINLDDDDNYIRPLVSHKLYDNTKFELGFDIISGHKDTFFGKWRKNDRFFIMFTQYF